MTSVHKSQAFSRKWNVAFKLHDKVEEAFVELQQSIKTLEEKKDELMMPAVKELYYEKVDADRAKWENLNDEYQKFIGTINMFTDLVPSPRPKQGGNKKKAAPKNAAPKKAAPKK
jgi:hypothetical protein